MRNTGKSGDCFKVRSTLHFNGTNKLGTQSAYQPAFNPFKKTGRIANNIGTYPVLFTKTFWRNSKRVMLHKSNAWLPHQSLCKGTPINSGYRCTELMQYPRPAARTRSCINTAGADPNELRTLLFSLGGSGAILCVMVCIYSIRPGSDTCFSAALVRAPCVKICESKRFPEFKIGTARRVVMVFYKPDYAKWKGEEVFADAIKVCSSSSDHTPISASGT